MDVVPFIVGTVISLLSLAVGYFLGKYAALKQAELAKALLQAKLTNDMEPLDNLIATLRRNFFVSLWATLVKFFKKHTLTKLSVLEVLLTMDCSRLSHQTKTSDIRKRGKLLCREIIYHIKHARLANEIIVHRKDKQNLEKELKKIEQQGKDLEKKIDQLTKQTRTMLHPLRLQSLHNQIEQLRIKKEDVAGKFKEAEEKKKRIESKLKNRLAILERMSAGQNHRKRVVLLEAPS